MCLSFLWKHHHFLSVLFLLHFKIYQKSDHLVLHKSWQLKQEVKNQTKVVEVMIWFHICLLVVGHSNM